MTGWATSPQRRACYRKPRVGIAALTANRILGSTLKRMCGGLRVTAAWAPVAGYKWPGALGMALYRWHSQQSHYIEAIGFLIESELGTSDWRCSPTTLSSSRLMSPTTDSTG
jgi:hypothetical protein